MNENEIYSIYFYRHECEMIQFNFQNVFILLCILETQIQRFNLCPQGTYNHDHKYLTIIDEKVNIKWTMAKLMEYLFIKTKTKTKTF